MISKPERIPRACQNGGGGAAGGGGAPRQEGWASKIPQSSYPDTCLSKGPE